MSDLLEGLVLEDLRQLDEKADWLIMIASGLPCDMTSPVTKTVRLRGDFASQAERLGRIEMRLDRIEMRLDRIERCLEIASA